MLCHVTNVMSFSIKIPPLILYSKDDIDWDLNSFINTKRMWGHSVVCTLCVSEKKESNWDRFMC